MKLNLLIERLFSLPFSCVNRGENGEIKTTVFGGYCRGRISGQALKRAVREMLHEALKETQKGIRATNLVPTIQRIWKEAGVAIDLSPIEATALKSNLTAIGTAGEAKGKVEKNAVLFIGLGEIHEIAKHLQEKPEDLKALCTTQTFKIAEKLKEVAEEKGSKAPAGKVYSSDDATFKKPLKDIPSSYDTAETLEAIWEALHQEGKYILAETEAELKAITAKSDSAKQRDKASKAILGILTSKKHGPDVAINGRMNAGNHDATVDSTCMFSHAISIGIHDVEEDFFVAKDESEEKEENGAGILGRNEGASHTYYSFANLDVSTLWENLKAQGYEKEEFINLVLSFLEATILSTPKARQSTMFGRTLPHYVRVCLKPDARVFSRIEAFVKPISGSEEGAATEAVQRLKDHDNVEKAYGTFNYLVNESIEGGTGSLASIKEKIKAELETQLQ